MVVAGALIFMSMPLKITKQLKRQVPIAIDVRE